ncbi:MAG: response regulator [Snowella sp.]|nr:response regulator [Snowella sp.]
MQGTLSEIDLRSILQLIELGQRTGQLFIETYRPARRSQEMLTEAYPAQSISLEPATSWFVFFVNGQVVYAADQTYSQMKRLRDYLRRYSITDEVPYFNNSAIATTNDPEYGYLWLLLEKNILTPHQARHIIRCMVEETLFDLFNVRQGRFIFEMGNALDPPMIAFEVGSLITQTTKQVWEWKQFHPHIQSPDQAMVITNPGQLQATLSDKLYQRLMFWANGKTALRQLARYLHRDLPTVARGLYPYAEQGLLQFTESTSAIAAPASPPWDPSSPAHSPKIVCIDDDISIGKQVELILNQQGYHCQCIPNPLEALSQVFQLQPDLILCDITMPQLDGYEICAMLRHSTAFRQTPLIMLTGKETFMDRVKARIVGATDYLTKPFGASELLLLTEKYLSGR